MMHLLGLSGWHGRVDALLVHAVVDVLLLALLTGVAYRRRHGNGEMIFALSTLNLGLFVTLVAISGDSVSAGAGFGLFGMLSLIRLRSASFTTVDMAYAFLALVLGLVMGLLDLPLVISAGLGLALVLLVLVGDSGRFFGGSQQFTLILDTAHTSLDAARADVTARLAMPVDSVSITEVDFVKETTLVSVVCSTAPSQARTRADARAAARASLRARTQGGGTWPVPSQPPATAYSRHRSHRDDWLSDPRSGNAPA